MFCREKKRGGKMVGFREREGRVFMKSVKNGVWREGKRGHFQKCEKW